MSASTRLQVAGTALKTSIVPRGNYLFSGGSHRFAICDRSSKHLYVGVGVKLDADSPLQMLIDGGVLVKEAKTVSITVGPGGKTNKYHKYTFFRPLVDEGFVEGAEERDPRKLNENDCLNFSEFLTAYYGRVGGVPGLGSAAAASAAAAAAIPVLPYAYKASVLASDATGDRFGVTNAKNRAMVSRVPRGDRNDHAVPQPGQTYAVVRSAKTPGGADYHIEFVVYCDGNVNITLLASADHGQTFLPEFAMYDTDPAKRLTFHREITGANETDASVLYSYYGNGETIVLTGRDRDVVVGEIRAELRTAAAAKARKNLK